MVDWARISRETFGPMVDVIVKRVHPAVQSIDGSGGDGGIDLRLHTEEGLAVYQVKSFTGRLSASRRTQIARSLEAAAEHDPVAWHLVVPLNPTPGEFDWFEGLAGGYSFLLEFHGLDWLDSRLAAMPDVERYFLRDGNAEVVQLLRELRDDVPDLADATVALDRVRTVQRQLEDTDPYYRYALTAGAPPGGDAPRGAVLSFWSPVGRVDVYPKYATATEDRPITVTPTLVFDGHADLARRFADVLDRGGDIDLPPQVVADIDLDAPGGLGGQIGPVRMRLLSHEQRLDPPTRVWAEIRDGDDVVQQTTFELTSRVGGRRAVTVTGTDVTGQIGVTVDMNDQGHAKFNLDLTVEGVPPATLLPAIRFVAALRPGRTLHTAFESRDGPSATAEVPAALVPEWMYRTVESLARLQEHAGTVFPVPEGLTPDEIDAILEAGRWLDGERTRFTWDDLRLSFDLRRTDVDLLLAIPTRALLFTAGASLELRDHRLNLGTVATHVPAARAINLGGLTRAVSRGDDRYDVVYEPAGDNTGTRWLKAEDDEELSA